MITALGRLTQEDQEFRSSLSNRMVDRVMLIYITSAPREPRQEDQAFKATHQILSKNIPRVQYSEMRNDQSNLDFTFIVPRI